MNEEKFSCWAIDFWEKNKELDSLHLLNKFMEEKYFPLDNKLKEVREYIEEHIEWEVDGEEGVDYTAWINFKGTSYEYFVKELLEILDKVD